VINDHTIVQRIFDACLSQPPIFSLYLIIATICHNRDLLLDNFDDDDPQTSLYIVFQQFINPEKNPDSFDVEAIIQLAYKMHSETGTQILKEVDRREVCDISEQVIEFREGSPLIHGCFVEYSQKYVTTDK
jgi:hypothetical protein